MLIPSQNALLKIFEEPAKHINFIITCNSKSCFLETIISRGSAYNLGNEVLAESGSDDDAMKTAAELLDIFAEKSENDFLCEIAKFQKDKELFERTLDSLCIILRDALVYSQGGNKTVSSYINTAKKLTSRLTAEKIIECINTVYILSENFKASANYNLTVTLLAAELYGIKTK